MTTMEVSQATHPNTTNTMTRRKRKPAQKQVLTRTPHTDYLTSQQPSGAPWRANPTRTMTLAEARRIALHMHRSQRDKTGQPYSGHLLAVERGVITLGATKDERIAALFHDAVEDHHTTLTHLKALGCTDRTLTIIEAVSKRRDEEQNSYLERIIEAGHPAIRVKVADLLHNTRHDRLNALPEYTRDRLLKKYRPALARLLLELDLIADEDTQRRLATKPLGSAPGIKPRKPAKGPRKPRSTAQEPFYDPFWHSHLDD